MVTRLYLVVLSVLFLAQNSTHGLSQTLTQATATPGAIVAPIVTSAVLKASAPSNPYTLNCIVSANASPTAVAPTGSATFNDLTLNHALTSMKLATPGRTQYFEAQPPMTIGNSPNSVVAGDFNEDGEQDLAVASVNSNTGSSAILIFLGNGNGTFQSPRRYSIAMPGSLFKGDFNADGHMDLLVTGQKDVSLFLGKGDGSFSI